MKKLITLLASVLIVCILSSTIAFAEENPLLAIAMEMVNDVHALANDTKYFESIGYNYEKDYVDSFADAECSNVSQIISVSIPGVNLLMLFAGGARMSTPGKTKCEQSVYSLGTMWNANKSANAISQSTLLTWSRSYTEPEDFQNCFWLVDCGDAIYGVSFMETGDGIITATAAPIFLNEGETIETVEDFIRERMPIASLEPISLE